MGVREGLDKHISDYVVDGGGLSQRLLAEGGVHVRTEEDRYAWAANSRLREAKRLARGLLWGVVTVLQIKMQGVITELYSRVVTWPWGVWGGRGGGQAADGEGCV